ncbi:MAG: MoaD/ThiS family protein [Promethearchaeota archaeon]|nr:MAG: MoaD/ThiS family protein [Candidatus Lokiarchaeota archaeon]
MVEILYFADFKTITKKEKETFHLLNHKSLIDLIQRLIVKYPSLEQILLDSDNGEIKKSISVAVNHSIINRQKIETYRLNKEDKVAFMLPVSGG